MLTSDHTTTRARVLKVLEENPTYKMRNGYDVSFGYTLRYYPDLQIDQAGPAGIMQPRVAGEYKNPMLHFFGATFHWN